ncbi:DoxX family protein [Microbacterium sp. RURRCA19A]|uniref:DoxX family protein n=1 Tax=Microbacterium sp. RURRCA19A TaxID=1907391 RepID=UPI000953AC6A|nr:DoxX family protein [Microbacterium sp. RURRCA19A]SIR97688.1 DoxX-like family protein [Microbacterium sp. RURRCA19A]
MIIALWILNGLLALAFLGAGLMKITRPRTALVSSGMGWADDFSAGSVKAIGAVEAIGAIGLILPLLTGIAPVLTPLSAVGLLIVMVGAVVVHVRRKENPVPPIVLAVLSAVSAVLGFLVIA